MATPSLHWTVPDLEVMPDDGGWKRYEIIAGELYVTRAPHFRHQRTLVKLCSRLDTWSEHTGLGVTLQAPGVIFSDSDAVIPDAAWISHNRLRAGVNAAGHLIVAPELVIEVLSPGSQNQRRDKEVKLKLYSIQGVQDYWVASWQQETLAVYRRSEAQLQQVHTLLAGDTLTSPLLPGFQLLVGQIFT